MQKLDLHSNESSHSISSIRQIPAMTHLLPSLTLRWVPPTEQYSLLHWVFLLPAGEHSTREGGRDDRLPGGRGKPLHHGTPPPLPPWELVRLHQVCPLPLGLHLHRLLVQHDDPHHPLLGRPLHPAPPLQEQPGRRGWDCWLCQHPDDRDQGQSDVRHPNEGFNKEGRISSIISILCPWRPNPWRQDETAQSLNLYFCCARLHSSKGKSFHPANQLSSGMRPIVFFKHRQMSAVSRPRFPVHLIFTALLHVCLLLITIICPLLLDQHLGVVNWPSRFYCLSFVI